MLFKCIFLPKNFVSSKKSSTFAAAFGRKTCVNRLKQLSGCGSSVGQNTGLSRRRSRVRVSSAPQKKKLKGFFFFVLLCKEKQWENAGIGGIMYFFSYYFAQMQKKLYLCGLFVAQLKSKAYKWAHRWFYQTYSRCNLKSFNQLWLCGHISRGMCLSAPRDQQIRWFLQRMIRVL